MTLLCRGISNLAYVARPSWSSHQTLRRQSLGSVSFAFLPLPLRFSHVHTLPFHLAVHHVSSINTCVAHAHLLLVQLVCGMNHEPHPWRRGTPSTSRYALLQPSDHPISRRGTSPPSPTIPSSAARGPDRSRPPPFPRIFARRLRMYSQGRGREGPLHPPPPRWPSPSTFPSSLDRRRRRRSFQVFRASHTRAKGRWRCVEGRIGGVAEMEKERQERMETGRKGRDVADGWERARATTDGRRGTKRGNRTTCVAVTTINIQQSVQCFGKKKTSVAVAHCKRGRGLLKLNGETRPRNPVPFESSAQGKPMADRYCSERTGPSKHLREEKTSTRDEVEADRRRKCVQDPRWS